MNAPMVLAPLILILPLVAFYLWMFRDMLHNDYLGPPPFVVSPVNGARYNWMFDFMFLNVFAAAIYFVNEYRNGRR
jgi:hypothetical protein